MYPTEYTKDGKVKHSNQCQMSFGRKDHKCPRCVEMLNGAPAKDGWQKGYYSTKKQQEQAKLEAIRTHDCKKANCGPVCTAFEW